MQPPSPPPPLPDWVRRRRAENLAPRVVAVANDKGGVGKTMCAICLAEAAHHRGLRVACADMDPQGDLTKLLLAGSTADLEAGVEIAFARGSDLRTALVESIWPGIFLIPADRELAAVESVISETESKLRLRRQLLTLRDFDLVVVDTPRTLSNLSVAALAAADVVVGVTEPSTLSALNLAQLAETIEKVAKWCGHPLRLGGVIGNLWDNTNEAERMATQLATKYGQALWRPFVGRYASVRESLTAYRTPLREYGHEKTDLVAKTFDDHLLPNLLTTLATAATDEGKNH